MLYRIITAEIHTFNNTPEQKGKNHKKVWYTAYRHLQKQRCTTEMYFSQKCYLNYCLEYIICTEYLQLFKAIHLLTNKEMRIVSVQTYVYLVFCVLDTTELTAAVQIQTQQCRESAQLRVKLRNL